MNRNWLAYFLVLLLIPLTLPINVNSLSCEDITLNANQTTITQSNLIICRVSITNGSQLIIKNSENITILNNLDIENNSKIILDNSNLTLKGDININNSTFILKQSQINFSDYNHIILTQDSNLLISYSNIISLYLEIGIYQYSYLNVSYSIFKGYNIIKPHESSEFISNSTHGFNLLLSDQTYQAIIDSSTFSLSLEINSTGKLNIQVPRGFYEYFNSSSISQDFLKKVRLEIYRSFINPPGLNPEVKLPSNGEFSFINSTSLYLSLYDVSNNINNLFGGSFDKTSINFSNNLKINFYYSEIKKWILHFINLNNISISNSSSLDIYAENSTKIYAYNARLIDNIVAYKNSIITLEKSSIIGQVILQDNSKLIAKDTDIRNLSNVYTSGNSTAYFSGISDIKYRTKANLTAFDVSGTAAVISATNTSLSYFMIKVSIVTKYPKNYTAIIGFDNRNGLIASFFLNNLPDSEYKISLIVKASDNYELTSEIIMKVSTGVPLSAPIAPVLKANATRAVVLSWNDPNGPFSPVLGYNIYRGDSPNSLVKIASVEGNQSFYIDTNVAVGKEYYYAITAYNEHGESPLSNVIQVKTVMKLGQSEQFILYTFMPLIAIISIILFALGYSLKKYKNKKFS